MRKIALVIVIICLFLTGCSGWLRGSYVYVTPHQEPAQEEQPQILRIKSYTALREALVELICQGREEGIFSVEELDLSNLEDKMSATIQYAMDTDPVGSYIVSDITYELGASGTVSAIAVKIHYNSNLASLRTMQLVQDMEEATAIITSAMRQVDDSVVVQVENYEELDFAQLMQNYADSNPEYIMEVPQVTVNTYPRSGKNRVVSIQFAYQTNRDNLRAMQQRVQDVFASAKLYVSGDGAEEEKFSQLYSFLTERFKYIRETSITPAYSLLSHGVGDSRAFAVVYAAMCSRAGLECLVVSGTHEGQSRFWNIICDDGAYYHVDLFGGNAFRKMTDGEMAGFVWDYSAYPECKPAWYPEDPPQIPEDTQPPEEETTPDPEETQPGGEETLPSEETIPEGQNEG